MMSSIPVLEANSQALSFQWRALFGRRRVLTVVIICALFVLLFSFGWKAAMWRLVMRVFGVGLGIPIPLPHSSSELIEVHA